MKIYNKIVLQWNNKTNKYDTVYEDSYDYNGAIDHAAADDLKFGKPKEDLEDVQDLLKSINKDIKRNAAGLKDWDTATSKLNDDLSGIVKSLGESGGTTQRLVTAVQGVRLGTLDIYDLEEEINDSLAEQKTATGDRLNLLKGEVVVLKKLQGHQESIAAAAEKKANVDQIDNALLGGMLGKVKAIGEQMKTKWGVAALFAAALVSIYALLGSVSDVTDNIGDSFGVIGVKDFRTELVQGRADFERMGFSAEELNTAVNTLSSDFGMTVGEAAGLAEEVANNARALGMTTDESAKLLGTFKTTAGLSSEQADSLIKQTGALAQSAGVAPAAIFKDMAGSAGVIAKFTDGTGENIARAAVKARQLGMSLADVASIAEGFLDVQGSIEKEMEASLMIGRDLNLTKARELSLAGDVEGLQDEILSIVGSQAEFNEMDVLQRKSLAAALNMDVEQLSKMVAGSEKGTEALKEMSEVDPAVIAGEDAMAELTKLKNEMAALKTEALGMAGAFSGVLLASIAAVGVVLAIVAAKAMLAGKGIGLGMSKMGKGVGKGMKSIGRGFASMGRGLAQMAIAGTAAIPILLTIAVVGASLALVITSIGYVISKLPPVINAMAKGFSLVAGAIGDVIVNVFNKVKELAEIGGMKLISTATGITAIGVSLAAFGGGSVLAGIGSFVGNLLGGDPIKKFERFAKMGPQLTEAAVGLRSIGAAIEVVNTERIKQIGDYLSGISLLKLAALGAMGKLSVPAGGGGGAATVGTTAGMTTMEQKEAEPLWVGGIKSEIRNFKHDLIGVFGFHGDEISAKIGKQVATNIVAVAG